MTEDSFLELLQYIQTLNKNSEDYYTAIALLMNSPISFLQQYKEQVEPFLNSQYKETLQELLRLASLSTSELFDELQKYADQIKTRYNDKIFQMGKRIIQLLSSRNDWDRQKVETSLDQVMQEEFVSIHGIFFVMLAGEERMTQQIPTLVERLFKDLDQDVLVEEAINALIKIGDDEVLDRVKPYVNDEDSGSFALDLIREIKSPYTEELLLQLLEEVEIEPVRTLIADALCRQLSVKAVPIIEQIVEDEYTSWYVDLQESLYCNCVMNEIDHPKLKLWREAIDDMVLNDDGFDLFPMLASKTEPVRTEPKIGRESSSSCL